MCKHVYGGESNPALPQPCFKHDMRVYLSDIPSETMLKMEHYCTTLSMATSSCEGVDHFWYHVSRTIFDATWLFHCLWKVTCLFHLSTPSQVLSHYRFENSRGFQIGWSEKKKRTSDQSPVTLPNSFGSPKLRNFEVRAVRNPFSLKLR